MWLPATTSLVAPSFFMKHCKYFPKWKRWFPAWNRVHNVKPSILRATKKYKNMGVSKNRGTPKSSILTKFPLFSPSILGYPYFWKHPHPNANDLAWRTAPDHQPCKPWLGECLGWVFFPQGTPTYPLEPTPNIPKPPQMKGIPKHKLLVGGVWGLQESVGKVFRFFHFQGSHHYDLMISIMY